MQAQLVTFEDTRKTIGYKSRGPVYALIAAGFLDARKLGGRTMITSTSLQKFVENLPKAPLKGVAK